MITLNIPKSPAQAAHFLAGLACFPRFACILLGMLAVIGCRGKDAQSGHLAGQTRYRLASSSMAPHIHGPTRVATCPHCSWQEAIAADTYRNEAVMRCYRCGGTCQVAQVETPGEIIRVLPARDNPSFTRFAVVALTQQPPPELPGPTPPKLLTKRVWGLPGETPAIAEGEFWINDTIFQKSLAQLRQLAIPLATYEPGGLEPGGQPAWSASPGTLRWKHHAPAAVHTRETPPDQWLAATVVTDDLPHNQGVRYQTLPVADLLFTLELAGPARQPIQIQTRYYNQPYRITVIPHSTPGTDQTLRSTRSTSGAEIGFTYQATIQTRLEVALCDHRLLVAFDDREAEAVQLVVAQQAKTAPMASSVTFGIEPSAVKRLEIARDILLRSGERNPLQRQEFAPLAADEYFLLGDNPPVSIDSRSFATPIRGQDITGLVEREFPQAASLH